MRFGVLGPIAVTTDAGEPVTVPGAKVRALLADLLAHRNQVVSADRLIDDLWADAAPANAIGALQVRVSQLRKALGDAEPGARDLVESRAPGYVLRTTDVDADLFAELASSTDTGPLTDALGLWRGEPYADVADAEYVRAEAARLAEARLAVHERLADTRLSRGEHHLVAPDLAALVARHPLREGLRALHLRALCAAGRQTEALESYAELRQRLADEMGLDPGPELVALHRRILEQDADLAAPPRTARTSLPARLDELVGRDEALAELRTLLPGHRLVTLTGPGGVGKTRLATEAAREQAFPDGAHLVELAGLPARSTAIADRLLASLGVHESAGAGVAAEERLLSAVRHRHLLLVLDNCEHVVEPVAALVARLLRDASGDRAGHQPGAARADRGAVVGGVAAGRARARPRPRRDPAVRRGAPVRDPGIRATAGLPPGRAHRTGRRPALPPPRRAAARPRTGRDPGPRARRGRGGGAPRRPFRAARHAPAGRA
jgi:DNA-binding SARP family transcriptional activator